MNVACVGGGPAGLYLAVLLKKQDPSRQITVFERNKADDTFGFGVVFSDQTLGNLAEADPKSYNSIVEEFAHWGDIDIHYQGQVLTSTGHGFAGMSRMKLLQLLQARCRELGVDMQFERSIDDLDELRDFDLIALADGVNSQYRKQLSEHLVPSEDWRPNRFIWLGTTCEFAAFKFYFKDNEHGLFRVHAYRYAPGQSTFIVECTEETWRNAGLDESSEDENVAYCEALFREELQGHSLQKNRSIWRQFPTVKCERWHHGNKVILGDAAHTAHFSIGSGTKLAMEDAIDLAQALEGTNTLEEALLAYQEGRHSAINSVQRAAQVSLEWFENTERYYGRLEPLQFAFSLLTRSLRITHENLRVRDPEFVQSVDNFFHQQCLNSNVSDEKVCVPKSKVSRGEERLPVVPPMFNPLRLRDLVLTNRVVVSPMSMYSAEDGTVGDFHLVHYGSRAIGGAGLILAEMTDVSAEARITTGCAGLYKDKHTQAWRRITDFVHSNSEAKIGIQLGHAGRKGSTKRIWEGIDQPLEEGEWPLISPSPLPYLPHSQVPREMNSQDMLQVIEQFKTATHRAIKAGFDLLELHLAHGYLLSCFISPLTNQRKDNYGGSLENRLRFPLEVFDAIRDIWPKHLPAAVRISATDWYPGGLSGEDSVAMCKIFKAHGCDFIDVSSGQVVNGAKPQYGRLYQTPFAERIRFEADIPVMTVGNISSFEDVNSILAAGRADLCAIAQAHLYEPYWTRHAAAEMEHPGPQWPKPYISVSRYKPRLK